MRRRSIVLPDDQRDAGIPSWPAPPTGGPDSYSGPPIFSTPAAKARYALADAVRRRRESLGAALATGDGKLAQWERASRDVARLQAIVDDYRAEAEELSAVDLQARTGIQLDDGETAWKRPKAMRRRRPRARRLAKASRPPMVDVAELAEDRRRG